MAYKINPDRTKPWNDLPELPIEESLYKQVDVLVALGNAKEALGRLQGRSTAIPNQGILINTISLQEAKESSAIENIFTTDDELYKAFSEEKEGSLTGNAKEVLRYREALWLGFDYLKSREGFDTDYLIKMYQTIKDAHDGIRPAIVQTYIKRGGSGPLSGEPFYVPPRGAGILEKKLKNLIDFVNDDAQYNIDPLLKMAMAHFQFEAIHPFRDGNGRTGRVFNIHILNKKALLDYPILYLSRYINQHKDDYYSGLAGVSQRGDWKTWFIFMLKAVEYMSMATYHKVNDIIGARDAILEELEKEKVVSRPDQLVQAIFTQPYTKVKHLTGKGKFAENTARAYLARLCEMQILEKRTIQGNHYYLNLELNRILAG